MVWSLRPVTSCRSDLLIPVTSGMKHVKLNLLDFCRIRNLLSSVFGSRGKLQSRPSLWFPVASVSRQRNLCCQPRMSERCVTRLASQQTRPRKSAATSRPRPASSRPATSPSHFAHLHTPPQTAAPGWVSLLSGRLCQQLFFSRCRVEPVLGQLQAPIWRQEAARMLDEGATCDSCQEQPAFS